jgi:N-dimethylarginine dimethylaminohydrolase
MNEIGALTRVAVKHARDAFVGNATIDAQWRALNYTARPDLGRAIDEHDRFVHLLQSAGATVDFLPPDPETTLDSIYTRDASVMCDRGVILCTMGKARRAGEPAAQERAFTRLGIPIAGRIESPGTLEGGDVAWLDPQTIAVGHGYRTNGEGIRQLREMLGPAVEVIEVALPHWRGDQDVMHLMSLISPVDRDAAVVYSPLMPVVFRRLLLERGIRLIEVPESEFDTMGANVLALAPGRCLVVEGNPLTRALLEGAGMEVVEYRGIEISAKGAGGPTCLTRPLARRA